MDAVNRGIVSILSEDSRRSYITIANKLGVSEGTVRNRVSKLLRHGVIRRFTIELGDSSAISGIVGIKSDPHKGTGNVGAAIRRISPQIRTAYEVSGEYDIICIVESPSLSELNSTLEAIRVMKGVLQTQTFMVMNKL